MKTGNIPLITGLVCSSIILNMINLSFAIDKVETVGLSSGFVGQIQTLSLVTNLSGMSVQTLKM